MYVCMGKQVHPDNVTEVEVRKKKFLVLSNSVPTIQRALARQDLDGAERVANANLVTEGTPENSYAGKQGTVERGIASTKSMEERLQGKTDDRKAKSADKPAA